MVGTLTFQKERLQDIYDEILPILKEHYTEIASYLDIKFEPNIEEYYKLEDMGFFIVYTAREDNELIGYNAFFIKNNMHYKSCKVASEDVIYIRKDKRGFGKHFIKWCDEQLKSIGVHVVTHHIKFKHDWSEILERMNYDKIDMILMKRLDKE